MNGLRTAEELLPPAIHLTAPCWRDFKKHVTANFPQWKVHSLAHLSDCLHS